MLPYLLAYSAQAGMLGLGMHGLPVDRGVRRHDVHGGIIASRCRRKVLLSSGLVKRSEMLWRVGTH